MSIRKTERGRWRNGIWGTELRDWGCPRADPELQTHRGLRDSGVALPIPARFPLRCCPFKSRPAQARRARLPSSTRKSPGLLLSVALLTGLIATGASCPALRAGDGTSAASPAAAGAPPVRGLLRPLGAAGAPRHRRLRQRHPLAPQGGCGRAESARRGPSGHAPCARGENGPAGRRRLPARALP